MNILITGGGGFVARHLIYGLMDKNKIYVITRNPTAIDYNLYKDVMIIDSGKLSLNVFEGIDVVINLAYPQNTDGYQICSGIDYTEKLLKFVREANITGFINISTQSVYGSKREYEASEKNTPCLDSLYSLGKYACEKLVDSYCDKIPHINIRMASLIGKDFDKRFLNKFISDVINEKQLSVQSGSEKIQFLDIRDAVDAICAVLKNWDYKESLTINLAGRESYSIKEYALMVNKIAEDYKLKTNEIKLIKNENSINSSMDGSLFNSKFHWEPQYNIKDSITCIFDYKLNQKNLYDKFS